MKIKTQGSEINILKGAKKTFAENKVRFIQVRLILSDIYEEVNSIGDIDNILRPFRYKLTATNHFNSH